jgi:hypothetical protein
VQPPYLILAAVILSFSLLQINQRAASPLISIVDRWLRWVVFALGAAQICRDFELVDRPYWVIAVSAFLLWFIVETLYNWLTISAISVSPQPLFPRYALNQSGAEWPVQPRLLRVREWLRAQGFHHAQALRAEVGGGIYLRVSVYQDDAALVRVEVTFLPQPNGAIVMCGAFTSIAEDGSRYVTDNLYIPFAGFYPENWLVERRPWCRSMAKMLARHRSRLADAGVHPVPFTVEPLADLNAGQHELDRLNTELGFLHPHSERDDFGKITQEGRYRVWKEFWMLKYLGRSSRYL